VLGIGTKWLEAVECSVRGFPIETNLHRPFSSRPRTSSHTVEGRMGFCKEGHLHGAFGRPELSPRHFFDAWSVHLCFLRFRCEWVHISQALARILRLPLNTMFEEDFRGP